MNEKFLSVVRSIAPQYNAYRGKLDRALKEKEISFPEWDRKVREAEKKLFKYLSNMD